MAIDGFYRIWLDDARLGTGWRAVIVYDVGSKWAHALAPATGVHITAKRIVLWDDGAAA